MQGRGYVIPEDVDVLTVPVLAHRVLLSHRAQTTQASATDIITDLCAGVPTPRRT